MELFLMKFILDVSPVRAMKQWLQPSNWAMVAATRRAVV
jgi:hypothetical protein